MAERPAEEPNKSIVATGVRGDPSVPRYVREAFGRLLMAARALPETGQEGNLSIIVSMEDLETLAHAMLVDFEFQPIESSGLSLIPLPLFTSEKDGRELTEQEELEEHAEQSGNPVVPSEEPGRSVFNQPPRSQFQEIVEASDKEHEALMALVRACEPFSPSQQEQLLDKAKDYLGLVAPTPLSGDALVASAPPSEKDLEQQLAELQNLKMVVEVCLNLGRDANVSDIASAIVNLWKAKNDPT